MKHLAGQQRQQGFTLIELVAVLFIMSIISVTVYQFQKNDFEERKVAIAAGHLQSVSKAANAYIRDNYSAIMSLATDSQPVIIRVSDLISTNYLQAGYSSVNGYQQATCALVLQPSPGQLTGLVVTQGGQELNDFLLSNLVSRIGASAGGIYTDTPGAIIGSRGSWAISHANYGNNTHLGEDCAGNTQPVTMEPGRAHVALWFENNDLTAGFLYREEIPGRPELNRMSTHLDMAGHDLTGASTVSATDAFDMGGTTIIDSSRNLVNIDSIFASGNLEVAGNLEARTIKPTLVVSEGGVCSESSAIATDASGRLLSCQ
ncbi:MAG: shufflon system plasmid conjugative transfer pilus tip adhesin PilV, partial [Methyloprofundus sp.]|nr:shufflon system plasmid conjugative transfer pilus tip adhesin PilV [Methyloprofundus sp.]